MEEFQMSKSIPTNSAPIATVSPRVGISEAHAGKSHHSLSFRHCGRLWPIS